VTASGTDPTSSPVASSSASPSPEPTGNLDSTTGAEVLDFLREAVDDLGQTLVIVTHDAGAAARADRVLFLADGRIVDELDDPDADAILDRIKELGG
jgi:putative ABC transport system ATP-binding protein